MPTTSNSLVSAITQRVGGQDEAVQDIVRRALATRIYPPEFTRDLGVTPVRGVLMYGPPGCGKTLLAREIASAMGARAPKIVNGPEMMSKYVGESEQYVRALFAEAEAEQAEVGDASALHVLVFDEMDAFTRERGSLTGDTSGIRDSVVNQLLAKMDGVEQLDNILVIGLTNRPDLMDPALLRPGRLEVQVLVPRPDVAGRQRIAAIHSKRLRERGCLDERAAACLRGGAFAETTVGFSGADIAGLIRAASSYALERYVDESLLHGDAAESGGAGETSRADRDAEATRHGMLEVRYDDLVRALREVNPTGSDATRADLASNGRGLVSSLRAKLRAWRCEARLHKLTDRSMREETLGV
jgi:vesicle-fusing ATPase